MKKRYCVLMSLCVVAALLLAGCTTADTKPSGDQAHAEQVVRDYFRYWAEKNLAGLQKTTNLYQTNVDWELDKLESVNLVSVTPGKVHTDTKQSFRATFDVKAKSGMFMTIDDGRHIWKIVLTRENTDAPWIMTDWGPVLDE